MKRRSFAILLTLLLALGLAACGGSSGAGANGSYTAAAAPAAADRAMEEPDAPMGGYWDEAENVGADGGSDARSALPEGVKMIYTANLELQTTEFEKAAADIRTLTQALGGYFEAQSVHNYSSGYRSADYTARVPAERFEDFLRQIGDLCHVVYQTQSADDVSESYYDVESRLETAKIKLDRLQDLLSRAEAMEDIITLESAISETEYQIESLSGEKRHYDSLIGYSTIYVSLNEVYRVTEAEGAPLTFGQRMGAAFREGLRDFADTMEDLAEWLAYNWLTLLALALIAAGAARLIRRGRAKRAEGGGNRGKLFGGKNKSAPAETAEEDKE